MAQISMLTSKYGTPLRLATTNGNITFVGAYTPTMHSHTNTMSYFNYHATAHKLIDDGKLLHWHIVDNYNGIEPALVLEFADIKHPVMPIRQHRWAEYLCLPQLSEENRKSDN